MGSEVTFIIGHRGTGKTSFLKEHLRRHPSALGFDLDAEIMVRTGESPAQILARSEDEFRNIERRILGEILHELNGRPAWIAAGAGFAGPVPRGVQVLWLRRVSDEAGRVFLHRPRLERELTAFAEYGLRFGERDLRFHQWFHEELTLPEGWTGEIEGPQHFVDLTVLPENFRQWESFWQKRQGWKVRRFELRDDLLSPEQMARAQADIPPERLLYSCRQSPKPPEGLAYDWPLEFGPAPKGATCHSLHEGDWAKLRDERAILKLAVMVEDWATLKRGHDWWLQDPERRAFLPRSKDGRWRWYRSLFGPRMPIHFIREGDGSSLDQPFLWQSFLQTPLQQHFGAVLGDPVEHSHSPMEHLRPGPFVSIRVQENEFAVALPILTELGLRFAAVTSPLKTEAGKLIGNDVANTLLWKNKKWQGTNTDVIGLRELGISPENEIWVWGQGAMLQSILQVWPQAQSFSARTGTFAAGQPDVLIWATGRTRPFVWPPDGIRPKLVLDLNYGDDSPGIEYAATRGIAYQSGLKLFKLQAEAQRKYWKAEQ